MGTRSLTRVIDRQEGLKRTLDWFKSLSLEALNKKEHLDFNNFKK